MDSVSNLKLKIIQQLLKICENRVIRKTPFAVRLPTDIKVQLFNCRICQ